MAKNQLPFPNTNSSPDIDQSVSTKPKKFVLEFDAQGIPILSKQRIILAVIALCIAIFLASLDGTIVATALPKITNNFNAANSAHWLVTANLLANTCFQPLFGKISDIFGRKETLILAIFIFEAGSAISGIVNSINLLIFSRALTGIGAAGIVVMVQIVVSEMVPIRERGKYTGFIGLAFGMASVVGPLLGGVFTDNVGYRWCFFINLPVGLVAGVVIAFLVKTKKPQGSVISKIKRFDFIGALLLIAGLVMFIIGLSFGGTEYPWSSATVLCLLIGGVLFLVLYILYDLKLAKEPILPLDLFYRRNLWSSVCAQFFMSFGLYGIIYIIPSYDTAVHNASASDSGISLLPFVLTMVVFSILGGVGITRTGKYIIMFRVGTASMALGIGLLATINQNTKKVLTIFYLALCGIGCGLSMQSFLICAQAAVPRTFIAGATSVIAFSRILSGAIGITLSTLVQKSVLTPKIKALIQKYPDNIDYIQKSIKNTSLIHSLPMGEDLKYSLINIYVSSITKAFIMFCAVLCLSFAITLISRHIPFEQAADPAKKIADSPPSNNNSGTI
ncbi:hypothetical protein BB561_005818 [Smittium simulii]|uniref:Major facilitator superfamily (MFS) profile domain-containing protein n=1 Tax=Smittium simulii TaxID=133385 RepID=A0A2T9Y835_9FUNG|nr:hypothetical protein BB561_005818 [Smittium simulii]